MAQFYDKIYENVEQPFGKPEKELKKIWRQVGTKELMVLDLGCGDGRHTIFLASKNNKVFAVDKSAVGLDKIRKALKNKPYKKNVCLIKADLKKFTPDESFDLVVCTSTLHEIGAKSAKRIIERAKASTKPGGIHYLTFFLPKKGTLMKKGCYYPKETTLIKQFYSGWETLKEKKETITHSHLIKKHKHFVCHLILKKPTKSDIQNNK